MAGAAKENDMVIYVDAVLNHKMGADDPEWFRAKEVDPGDRTRAISDLHDIKVGTSYPISNGCLTSTAGLD